MPEVLNRLPSPWKDALVLCLPVLLLAAFIQACHTPWEWFYNYGDPDYFYWFNAIQLLEGLSPTHIDHPGSFVHLLGAMVLRLRYLLAGSEASLLDDFFAHSLDYQRWYFGIVVASFLAAAWSCGLRLRRLGIDLPSVLFVQLVPLFVFDSIIYAYQITPEAWIVVGYYLWIPFLAKTADGACCDFREAMAHGILFGFLVGLKLHTASGAVLLLLLPGWRARLVCAAFAALYFLCITAIFWDQYPRFWSWAISLLIMREGYGQGGPGLPSLSWMGGNWLGIWWEGDARAMQAALCAFPLLLPLATGARGRNLWLILGGAALSTFLVLKQTHGARYFLILLPYLALAILELRSRLIRGVAIAAGVAYLLPVSVENADRTRRHRSQLVQLEAELRPLLERKYSGCVHVSKLAPIREFGLLGGNSSTHFGRYSERLRSLFPRMRFFFEESGVYHFEKKVEADSRGLYVTERFPCQVLVTREIPNLPDPFPAEMMRNLVPLELSSGGNYRVYGKLAP